MDRSRFRRGAARSDADGRARRRVVVRRSRRRLQAGGPRPRRDVLTPNTSHQPLETRTRDGVLAERQAVHALLDAEHRADGRGVARWVGIDAEQVVIISEYTGGGFGSKIPAIYTIIPALLSKKAKRR